MLSILRWNWASRTNLLKYSTDVYSMSSLTRHISGKRSTFCYEIIFNFWVYLPFLMSTHRRRKIIKRSQANQGNSIFYIHEMQSWTFLKERCQDDWTTLEWNFCQKNFLNSKIKYKEPLRCSKLATKFEKLVHWAFSPSEKILIFNHYSTTFLTASLDYKCY